MKVHAGLLLSVIHDCKTVETSHTIIRCHSAISCWQVDTGIGCHKSVTNVVMATWTGNPLRYLTAGVELTTNGVMRWCLPAPFRWQREPSCCNHTVPVQQWSIPGPAEISNSYGDKHITWVPTVKSLYCNCNLTGGMPFGRCQQCCSRLGGGGVECVGLHVRL